MEKTYDDLPPWGSPDGVELLNANPVVVVERGGQLMDGNFDLITTAGTKLGSVVLETAEVGQFFDVTQTPTYRILDAHGQPIGVIVRSGTLAHYRFMVLDMSGKPFGLIEDGGTTVYSQLMTAADGTVYRMIRGVYAGSGWGFSDGHSHLGNISTLSREKGHHYTINLSSSLVGAHRLLLLLTPVIVDYGEHPERR